MTLRTRSAVTGLTRFDPLMTRETVALDTPAIFAMSRMSISVASPAPEFICQTDSLTSETSMQSANKPYARTAGKLSRHRLFVELLGKRFAARPNPRLRPAPRNREHHDENQTCQTRIHHKAR